MSLQKSDGKKKFEKKFIWKKWWEQSEKCVTIAVGNDDINNFSHWFDGTKCFTNLEKLSSGHESDFANDISLDILKS